MPTGAGRVPMFLFALAQLFVPTAAAVTLADALRAADDNGVDLALLRERTESDATLRGQAWSLVQPKLVLGGSYTRNEYGIELDFSSMIPEELAPFLGDSSFEPISVLKEEYWAYNVSIVQPLFNGSAIPLLRGAYDTVAASRADADDLRTQVHAGIARAYYGVVVAREGERVADRALTSARRHAELARAAVAAGTAPPTARLQGEISVARAERELLSAREGRVSAELALAELTGLASDVPVETPTPPEIPWASPDEALDAAARRPAIVAADLRARAARMQGVATGLGWLPTIDGRFTWSYSGNTGFSDDPSMWMVVVEADWVLWDGGYRIAEQRRAAVQARMAKLAGDKTRLDTEERVRGLWEKHASAVAGLVAVERERALSEENTRIAATAFEAGLVTLLELEDARLGLQAAELALLSTRMERDLAAIDLLAAVGRRLPGAP